jgi:hypothetical protein
MEECFNMVQRADSRVPDALPAGQHSTLVADSNRGLPVLDSAVDDMVSDLLTDDLYGILIVDRDQQRNKVVLEHRTQW